MLKEKVLTLKSEMPKSKFSIYVQKSFANRAKMSYKKKLGIFIEFTKISSE